jgi:hypothetical protein
MIPTQNLKTYYCMKLKIKSLLKVAAMAAAFGVAGSQQADAATVSVNADIAASQTWSSTNTYILENVVYVISGATLTIEPGTVIRGEPESAPGAFDPGTLVITRGSRIIANGTPTNPIIFTDLFDDQVPGGAGTDPQYSTWSQLSGQWGGLVLLGNSYIAVNTLSGPDALRDNQIEGLTASTFGRYGGGDDDDNTGELSYVSIRYGGFNLSANNEINGLTLGAVGRMTSVHHIEAINIKDDAFEFFGGTVNTKNMVAYSPGDDGFDYDEGFRGKGQFWFLVQGDMGGSLESGLSDKGAEQDGGLSPDGSQPYSIPTFYNATYVGLGASASYGTKARNTALIFRDNAGGRYYNSIFTDFGGAGVIIEQEGGAAAVNAAQRFATTYAAYSPNAGAAFYAGPNEGNQLELLNNVWFQSAAGWPNISPTAASDVQIAGGANVASVSDQVFNVANNNAVELMSPLTSIVRTPGAANRPEPITLIDPRPVYNSAAMMKGRVIPNDGFFTDVCYKGAFSPASNWLKGWTLIDRLNLLPSSTSSVLFEDNFDRADSSALGAPWVEAVGNLDIASNQMVGSAAVHVGLVTGSNGGDVSAEANISVPVSGQLAGLFVRANATGTQFYWGVLLNNGAQNLGLIYKKTPAGLTLLTSGITSSNSGLLRLDVVGSTLKLNFNDVQIASSTDTEIAAAGLFGVLGLGGSYDNYKVTSAVASLPFADDFNRPDSTNVGAVWNELSGDHSIVGNELIGSVSPSIMVLNGPLPLNSSVQMEIDLGTTGLHFGALLSRFGGTGAYTGVVFSNSGSFIAAIYRIPPVGAPVLLNSALIGSGTGHLRFDTSGSNLSLYLNGAQILTASDGVIATAGQAGVLSQGNAFDCFSAFNLP